MNFLKDLENIRRVEVPVVAGESILSTWRRKMRAYQELAENAKNVSNDPIDYNKIFDEVDAKTKKYQAVPRTDIRPRS